MVVYINRYEYLTFLLDMRIVLWKELDYEKNWFFDTKPYDKIWFEKLKEKYGFEFKYFESKLNSDTAMMCSGLMAWLPLSMMLLMKGP